RVHFIPVRSSIMALNETANHHHGLWGECHVRVLAFTLCSDVGQSCPGPEMKIKRLVLLLLCTAFAMASASAAPDENADSEWRIADAPFHALNITSDGSSFWICGTDEAIAVSPDSGVHWTLKHHTQDG